MYKRILVPLDGSELAEEVFPYVRALAECTGAEIVLLRVLVDPMYEYLGTDPRIAATVLDGLEAEITAYLGRWTGELKQGGFKVSNKIVRGPIASTILDVAEEIQADLIAMSTHGRSGVARWLIGSVADRIVHGAKVPVLLVRPTSAR